MTNAAYRGMLWRRIFCRVPPKKPEIPRIWLNGVSVGETIALGPLIRKLEEEYPGIVLIISCTTGTGYQRACSLYSKHTIIGYPLDFSWIVDFFLRRIKPDIVISLELDLWPNFLMGCKKRSIPFIVVSGRLSENSTRGYEKFAPIIAEPFGYVTLFLAQDTIDAERATRIGIRPERVQVGGHLKFDLLMTEIHLDNPLVQLLKKKEKR